MHNEFYIVFVYTGLKNDFWSPELSYLFEFLYNIAGFKVFAKKQVTEMKKDEE